MFTVTLLCQLHVRIELKINENQILSRNRKIHTAGKKNSYFSYLTIWQFESRLYPLSSPTDGTRMRFLEIPPAQSWRQRALPSPVRLCTGGDCCSCCRWQRRDQSHSGERLGAGSSSAGSRMCQRASSELNILFHSPSVPVWVEGEAAGNKTPKIVLCITHTHTVEQ